MESVQYSLLSKKMALIGETNTSKEVTASKCYILALIGGLFVGFVFSFCWLILTNLGQLH